MLSAITGAGRQAQASDGREAYCQRCDGKVKAVQVEGYRASAGRPYYQWDHADGFCGAARDGWADKATEALARDGGELRPSGLIVGERAAAVIASAGGAEPAVLDYAKINDRPDVVWVVDARNDDLCWSHNCPGDPLRTHVGMLAWDPIAELFEPGDGRVTVFAIGATWKHDALFVPMEPLGEKIRKVSGKLAGYPCRFASGRFVSFAAVRAWINHGTELASAPQHDIDVDEW